MCLSEALLKYHLGIYLYMSVCPYPCFPGPLPPPRYIAYRVTMHSGSIYSEGNAGIILEIVSLTYTIHIFITLYCVVLCSVMSCCVVLSLPLCTLRYVVLCCVVL